MHVAAEEEEPRGTVLLDELPTEGLGECSIAAPLPEVELEEPVAFQPWPKKTSSRDSA